MTGDIHLLTVDYTHSHTSSEPSTREPKKLTVEYVYVDPTSTIEQLLVDLIHNKDYSMKGEYAGEGLVWSLTVEENLCIDIILAEVLIERKVL